MRIIYHHRTRSTDAQRIHILEMVNAFSELGHDVEIVSLVATDTEKENAARDAGDAGWQKMVRRIPFAYELVQLGYNLVGIPLLAARVMAKRTDFLYERYSLFNFTGVLVARLFGKPVALEVNSPFALEQTRDKQIRASGFAKWTERVICNLATKVIIVSTPLREIMIELGVKADKLVVMPNGVRTDLFKAGKASAELKTALGLQGKTIVGFVGWFRKWHGLEMLVDAFHAANLAEQNAALLLVGDGPAMEDLRRAVERYGLTKAVVFTGPLPHEKVPQYLNLTDIAVQPAANEYCCPMKILEYMALGKAIVAPRQENIQELLREEEAEYFTPGKAESLAAALGAMVGNRARAEQLGRNARQAIMERGFLWERNAQRVIAMVRDSTVQPVTDGGTRGYPPASATAGRDRTNG
jgi:glycosyltransferase involved in cell wall biosynthesis